MHISGINLFASLLLNIMSWISFLLSSLLAGRKRPVKRIAESDQDPSAVARLDKLPVEVIQRIAEFLPPDSAACLILSKKILALAIGHRSWVALRSKQFRYERLKFLILMQRDLLEWVLCYHCEKLHPVKRKPISYTTWLYLDEIRCSEADGIVELLPNYILRWQHAHMIMKLNRLNSTNNDWLNALSHFNFRCGVPYAYCCARIANEHLLVKLEYRILLRRDANFDQVHLVFPAVCPHWKCFDEDQGLAKVLRCHLSHKSNNPCAECIRMVQCQWCATEFVVAFLDSTWSFNGHALYITAWKDLGPCQTPFDSRWRAHTLPIIPRYIPRKSPVHFTPHSIRSAFEDLGSPKGNGLASVSPLDSDVEFSKRIDECLRPTTQSKQSGDWGEAVVSLPRLDFSSLPPLSQTMFS
jgi:hypothetical protein